MQAMDAKESKRKGKSPVKTSEKSSGNAAYELGAKKPKAPEPAASSAELAPTRKSLTRKQLTCVAGGALLLAVSFGAYYFLAPSAWESEQHSPILQIKAEGDRLAADGKLVEAFKTYDKIILMTANKTLHDQAVKKAVAEVKEARLQLFPRVRDLEDRAKTAKYRS
jgi:hypothetical protein